MSTWIAGVDGCKTGWIVATAPVNDIANPRITIIPDFADVFSLDPVPKLVAVDMPIGLPNAIQGSGRGPEQAARALLGRRKSSVFSIPSRMAVEAEPGPFANQSQRLAAHAITSAVARSSSQPPKGVSIQAFGIFPKIREVDSLLRQRRELIDKVYEVHPEVAFWRMNSKQPLSHPKKSKSGQPQHGEEERRALLEAHGISVATLRTPPPRGAATDDLLDALACLVVGRHIHFGNGRPLPDLEQPLPGLGQHLPELFKRDAHGLPIAIWAWD